MKKFIKLKLISQIALTSFIAVLAIASVISAATTIGSNISTGGTLSVTGATTFNSVSYTWPSSDGSSGQFLTSDGAGALSWSTASPSSGGGWTDNGVTVSPTSIDDQFLIGTTTAAGLSQLTVEATSTAAIPLTLKGYTGQSANLFQVQNVAESNLFTINSSGAITTGVWNGTALTDAYVSDTLTCSDLVAGSSVVSDSEVDNDITASNYLSLTAWYATTTHSLINSLPALATIGTITSGTWNGTAIDSAYLDTSVILSTEIDTIAELNAILTGEDVASTTWAGATSINTLGTVTTGVWNGTAIGSAYIADAYLLNTGDAATGDYNFDSGTLMIDSANNKVGVGTSTPANQLEVHATTGTSTVSAIAEAASTGGRIILEDSDGAGCTEIYVLDGVITSATVTCPAN